MVRAQPAVKGATFFIVFIAVYKKWCWTRYFGTLPLIKRGVPTPDDRFKCTMARAAFYQPDFIVHRYSLRW